jgi:hypothetical protein
VGQWGEMKFVFHPDFIGNTRVASHLIAPLPRSIEFHLRQVYKRSHQ